MNRPQGVELYMIRHAQTTLNAAADTVGGRSNHVELTDLGREQARSLGRGVLAKDILPDVVYASPAVRTLATARLSLKEMELDLEPIVDDDLQELSQGPYEGLPLKDIFNEAELERIQLLGKDHKLPGGESFREVGERMFGWVKRTVDVSDPTPRRVFVYTHGNAIRALVGHIRDLSHADTYGTLMQNAKMSLLVPRNGEWQVEFVNKDPEEIEVHGITIKTTVD